MLDAPPYVIAEIGANHGGSMKTAKEMIRAAKNCGCNAVKFQKRDNKSLYTKEAYNRPYNSENSYGATYGEHREALEFDIGQFKKLKKFARKRGIDFGATAFDIPSARLLAKLGVDFLKIASGDLLNEPLQNYAAESFSKIIFSTGGAESESDIYDAYARLSRYGASVTILHCTSGYPAEYRELNLRNIETLRETFSEATVGWSSHARGINQACTAYALGARVFEAHFTLDRTAKGTDNAFSLEPSGMAAMVRYLRYSSEALGSGERKRLDCETKALKKQWKNSLGHITLEEIGGGWVLEVDPLELTEAERLDGIRQYNVERDLDEYAARVNAKAGLIDYHQPNGCVTFPEQSVFERQWGEEKLLLGNEHWTLKKITMKPFSKGGLQRHYKKFEGGVVIKGGAFIEFDPDSDFSLVPVEVRKGDCFYIPQGAVHRITARKDGLTYIEASTPHLHDREHVEYLYGEEKETGGLPSTKEEDVVTIPESSGTWKKGLPG